MTLGMVVFSMILVPLFLVLRWPFFRLPLHMDTGYYVSNHTICTRKLDFSMGWNAAYAGCSKVVPEFFYSAIFLLHGGGERYKFYSRLYFSAYCFLVAMVVGYTSYIFSEGSGLSYLIGFTIFCLLSSEPHYGIYFENGEQFELLPQAAGFLLTLLGLGSNTPWIVGAGVGLWALESYFIKLSSLPATGILAIGTGYLAPTSALYTLLFSALASAAYLLWVLYNGKDFRQMWQALVGHEIYGGHTLSVSSYVKRLFFKVGLLGFISSSHPIIPALALVGLLTGNRKMHLLFLYLAVVTISYVIQSAHVWYYTIPFLPVIALFATFGVEVILQQSRWGPVIVAALLLAWTVSHLWHAYRMDLKRLNRWTWFPYLHPYIQSDMPDRNLELDNVSSSLRELVRHGTFLVLGNYNQAYVLVGRSYPTEIISVAPWLDEMSPDWSSTLCGLLRERPPSFVLDTEDLVNRPGGPKGVGHEVVSMIREKYRLVFQSGGQLSLYALGE